MYVFVFYRWADIAHVINHKKDFHIDLVSGGEKVEFVFPEAEIAKNAWRFCILQHIFFKDYEPAELGDQSDRASINTQSIDVSNSYLLINSYILINHNLSVNFFRINFGKWKATKT